MAYFPRMLYDLLPEDIRIFLVSLIVVLILWNLFGRKRNRNLPPGPYGLPFIGYVPFLTDKPYLKFEELRKKYGSVYSMKLGSMSCVILSDYDAIKEAFAQDAFNGRPPDSAFEINKESLRVINGPGWKDIRRFSMHVLRDLGLGKASMEQLLNAEINELLGRLEHEAGKPIVSSNYLAPSMSNNMSMLMFGKRRKFDDPKRVLLDGIIRDIGRLLPQVGWFVFFPWVRAIANLLRLGNRKTILKNNENMRNYIREEVSEHQKSLEPNNMRDFIDGFLQEMEKRKNDPNSYYEIPILEDHVVGFFAAGSETVRVSMDWLLLICAAYPNVQKKVQGEIDDVVGRDRLPSRLDQKLMPFTEAVTLEMWRWKTLVPINILRYTTEDATVHSYFIPKSTYILANFWSVHNDPKLWGEDAAVYKPERFLAENGKKVKKPEYIIPFSIGKRSCPGESLAIVEVFLYFTSILQKFNVKLPKGAVPDFDGVLGIGYQPKPYKLIFELRK